MNNYQQLDTNTLGFGRGNVGFIAVGYLDNVQFDVPLADGDYCDLVSVSSSGCGQYITVSGGKATITTFDNPTWPVVAFCVGCDPIV